MVGDVYKFCEYLLRFHFEELFVNCVLKARPVLKIQLDI